MSPTARSTRCWFSASFIHRLTPEGCGSGTATASPWPKDCPTLASRLGNAEQLPDREPAHRDDQPRLHQPELPLAPERAQLLLTGGRSPVTAAGSRTTRIAASDRGAVERRVERVLVEPEPAAQRLAGPTSPWPALLALDHARRLAEEIRRLSHMPLEHRTRLDRKPSLRARTARTVVTLERGERPVRRPPPRHPRERTTTNQFPSKRTSPSPSSSASSGATK